MCRQELMEAERMVSFAGRTNRNKADKVEIKSPHMVYEDGDRPHMHIFSFSISAKLVRRLAMPSAEKLNRRWLREWLGAKSYLHRSRRCRIVCCFLLMQPASQLVLSLVTSLYVPEL